VAKRFNPYTALKAEFTKYVNAVEFPKRKAMWTYPKARLGEAWNLAELWERVAAAEQLGYDVVLTATAEGLVVTYRQKRPDRPWETRA
jgi:hypothetical protein